VSLADPFTGSGSTGSNVAAGIDAGLAGIPVTITKDDGTAEADPGDDLVYTITVTNLDPLFTVPVTVTNTLPSQLINTSASDSGQLAGGVITWPATNVVAGSTLTYTLMAKVDPAAQTGTSFTNTANVSGCTDTSCTATDTNLIPAPFLPAHLILPFTGGTGLASWRVTGAAGLLLALLALLTFRATHQTRTHHRHTPRHTQRP
jgi:uncharacterized repeat protein (TIGR01451 family)